MKPFVILLLVLIVSANSYGQSKKLNKLFKKLAWTFATTSPLLIEESKEVVVPFVYNPEILYTIKWKEIDSVAMWDTGGNIVDLFLYGKGLEYRQCHNQKDTCIKVYFDSLYRLKSEVNQIWIPIVSKRENGMQMLNKKVRKKFRDSFQQLNIHLSERYGTKTNTLQPNRPPIKGIIVYLDGYLGESHITAGKIQEAKELRSVLSTYKILSFKFYIVGASLEAPPVIFNEGVKFNDELIRLLKRTRPGTTIVFDEIKVLDGGEKSQFATAFAINAT